MNRRLLPGVCLAAFRASGRERDTIVIFASDHGLALGRHGLIGKQDMYDHTVGVPLIMRGPGIPANRRFAAQTYLRVLPHELRDLAGDPRRADVERGLKRKREEWFAPRIATFKETPRKSARRKKAEV